ncbi:MAG: hypothetical protein ACO1N8_08820 [Methylophilus sp.]
MKHICWTLLFFASQFSYAAAQTKAIPQEAKCVISQVHAAAKQQDTKALKMLMTTKFIWSFGGDADAKQALQAWQENPDAFKQLYRITGMNCIVIEQDAIECPKNAGLTYRAGFIKTPHGWLMEYFVEGD